MRLEEAHIANLLVGRGVGDGDSQLDFPGDGYDFASRHTRQGRYVYLGSLEVCGARDIVPRTHLIGTLWGARMDPYLLRFAKRWLTGRRLWVRLATSKGRLVSRSGQIPEGAPQGGALSPFLWLRHFDDLHRMMRNELRSCWGALSDIDLLDVYFADDVAPALAREDPGMVAEAARALADGVKERLSDRGLTFGSPRSPGGMTAEAFRRVSGLVLRATRHAKKDAAFGRMANAAKAPLRPAIPTLISAAYLASPTRSSPNPKRAIVEYGSTFGNPMFRWYE